MRPKVVKALLREKIPGWIVRIEYFYGDPFFDFLDETGGVRTRCCPLQTKVFLHDEDNDSELMLEVVKAARLAAKIEEAHQRSTQIG